MAPPAWRDKMDLTMVLTSPRGPETSIPGNSFIPRNRADLGVLGDDGVTGSATGSAPASPSKSSARLCIFDFRPHAEVSDSPPFGMRRMP